MLMVAPRALIIKQQVTEYLLHISYNMYHQDNILSMICHKVCLKFRTTGLLIIVIRVFMKSYSSVSFTASFLWRVRLKLISMISFEEVAFFIYDGI